MKVSKSQIDAFLKAGPIAIAGVSKNEKKFGRVIYEELKAKGFEVYGVNPNTRELNGEQCYPSVDELPGSVESLLIVTPKTETDEVLKQAINKGIKHIWVQQFSDTANTIQVAEEYSREIIHNKCIFMFAEPVAGFHKFHRTIVKYLGRLPK